MSSSTPKCRGTYCNFPVEQNGDKCHDCAYLTSLHRCLNKFCPANTDGTISTASAVSGRKDGLCADCHNKHVHKVCRYSSCQKVMVATRKDHFCVEHHPFENRSLDGQH